MVVAWRLFRQVCLVNMSFRVVDRSNVSHSCCMVRSLKDGGVVFCKCELKSPNSIVGVFLVLVCRNVRRDLMAELRSVLLSLQGM